MKCMFTAETSHSCSWFCMPAFSRAFMKLLYKRTMFILTLQHSYSYYGPVWRCFFMSLYLISQLLRWDSFCKRRIFPFRIHLLLPISTPSDVPTPNLASMNPVNAHPLHEIQAQGPLHQGCLPGELRGETVLLRRPTHRWLVGAAPQSEVVKLPRPMYPVRVRRTARNRHALSELITCLSENSCAAEEQRRRIWHIRACTRAGAASKSEGRARTGGGGRSREKHLSPGFSLLSPFIEAIGKEASWAFGSCISFFLMGSWEKSHSKQGPYAIKHVLSFSTKKE